ncbi:hypothetical protein METBIDRAFT_33041 [Metschnikowia bicuspidata var. bicuspidata NRRL YB-4993]|uniref:DM2 domain-containing protein n=1 Tax=Metschnikowia bicuspidata var. bicuspidata NRRL YB-4993 TaxID=869754 RepID=A0A1A0H846_9ASCO|nr:hypothetical protein METBIDRAFT_33041 [Metschnikowia bicuspidata var. bicuspidata NRRL YB-4993]OBA20068.1 hypothetical protein METBIDRAFT_33041 [Metschnikowia bicuspidata var. bicuspidata NRRL YB-4993]
MGPSAIPVAQNQSSSAADAPTKIHQVNAPTPAISYTPTDVTIPAKLYDKVPNLEWYKKLQEAERKLDLLIAQKSLDFQSVQAASMQPHIAKKETGTLRVFVYNTCENMPWQKMGQGATLSETPGQESHWTLRIEGRFIPDSKENVDAEKVKFSSFLSGLSVEIVPNGDYPNLQGNPSNVIEWRDSATGQGINPAKENVSNGSSHLFDGIDIKRPGIFNIGTKIAIFVKEFSSKLVLSAPMAEFTGRRELSQQEIVFHIWQYVLYKDLFKKSENFTKVPAVSSSAISNPTMSVDEDDNEISVVHSDDTLRSLLKVDAFKFRDLYKLIQPHLNPREPIVFDYEIVTTKSTTLGDVVIDIPIELPLSMSKIQKEIIEENKKAFEIMSKSDEHVQFLNQRISLGIAALHNVNSREIFYRELSEDPVSFLRKWLESQAETLKALKSEEGYNEETARRAEFFKENEELVKQKIELMLGAQKL